MAVSKTSSRTDTDIPINNVRELRVGSLFLNDLDVLLRRLDAGEFKAFWKFRTEFVYNGCCGLPDNDKELMQRLDGYKKWPSLRQKLLTLGFIEQRNGKLFDPDVAESIKRQRKTSKLQRERASKRWDQAPRAPLAAVA